MSLARHLPPPLHRLAVQVAYGLANVVRPVDLPTTGAPLHLNACFHTERLDDDTVFQTLQRWCREFRAITGVRPWLCVMTPEGPVGGRLTANGFSPDRYGERVQALAEVGEIGYHGHYHGPDGQPLAGGRFDLALAGEQIDRELAWLQALGFTPRIYTGGWWVLTPELLQKLAAAGIRLDCSTRGSQGGTFGDRYPDPLPAFGRRFQLVPPIVEVGSLPYFSMPWSRYQRLLCRWLPACGQRSCWAVLPAHDYALVGMPPDDLRVVRALTDLAIVRWMDAEEAIGTPFTQPLPPLP